LNFKNIRGEKRGIGLRFCFISFLLFFIDLEKTYDTVPKEVVDIDEKESSHQIY